MDRFKPRTSARRRHGFLTVGLAASGLAAAVTLGGCSAGQVSQTATQEPAVNGASTNVGPIGFRCATSTCAPRRPPTTSSQAMTPNYCSSPSTTSPDTNDKLLSITSDVGTVNLSGGDTSVPANGVLVVGEPEGQTAPLDAAEKADAVEREDRPVQTDHQRADVRLHVRLSKRPARTRWLCPSRRVRRPAREMRPRKPADTGVAHYGFCRSYRLRSRCGQGAFAVPLLGVPPRHREMGWPLRGLRHLGHGRRSRRAGGGQRLAYPPRSRAHLTRRADQLDRPW